MASQTFIVAATAIFLGLGQFPLQAATIQYTADSFSDGVTGSVVGGADSTFELYGVGYAQSGTTLYIGLSTNLPIGGSPDPLVAGGTVAWGDLFLNFSDQPLAAAVPAGVVYGVRFDVANESSAPQLGLYRVQQTGSVTPINNGFASLADYQQVVTDAGGVASLGDIALDGRYLSTTDLPQNVISQGELLSTDVSFIEDFSSVGFAADFGLGDALAETGSYSYGFSVDTSELPTGNFIAHLLAECANDGIAFIGEIFGQPDPDSSPESVPEPGLGLALLGMGAVCLSDRLGKPK